MANVVGNLIGIGFAALAEPPPELLSEGVLFLAARTSRSSQS